MTELKSCTTNLQKKKIYDAIAAASIVNNCAGVDTSKSQVVTLANFVKFLETEQLDQRTEDEVRNRGDPVQALRLVHPFPENVWAYLALGGRACSSC